MQFCDSIGSGPDLIGYDQEAVFFSINRFVVYEAARGMAPDSNTAMFDSS